MTATIAPEFVNEARRELARRNLGDFCRLMDPNYESTRHTNALIAHLEALERRDIRKLAVFIPPRHSKTYHTSERFPAWALGRNPKQAVILASYGSELAEKNSRVVRTLFQDERFPFRAAVASDSSAVNRWSTDAGGTVLAAGVGSAMTGFGAHVLLIDDPFKDREQADSLVQRDRTWSWYAEVARTRLMPGAVQMLTTTRWHDDDTAGRILNGPDANEWTVFSLPAIAEDGDVLGRAPGEALWPEWYPLSFLHEQREVLGARAFASLYQQSPLPATGGTFQRSWFDRRYDDLWEFGDPSRLTVIQTIDGAWKTGVSNDYSVVATWASDGASFLLVDVWRKKLEFHDLKRAVVEQYRKHSPDAVYCEEAASGFALLSELRSTTGIPIIGRRPQDAKIARAERIAPLFEAGKVALPKGAPWLDEWIHEHLRFPGGAHDDMVDTTSLALHELRNAMVRKIRAASGARIGNWKQR